MTGIAEMVRSSLVAAVLVGGCSSTTTPQPCLTDSGSISPAMRWYGARLDEIHGKGTSCQAPVVVKGAYLPCERWSESGRCALKEDCGSYVLLMQRENLPAKKVYFNSTSFRGV